MNDNLFKFYQLVIEDRIDEYGFDEFIEQATAFTQEVDGEEKTFLHYVCEDGSLGDFPEFFREWSKKNANELRTNIDLALSKASMDELPTLIPKIIYDTNYYLRKMKLMDSKKIDYILEDYLAVVPDIYTLCKHYTHLHGIKIDLDKLIQASNQDVIPSLGFEAGTGPKIQWLGNVNVLITLFYDLLYGQDNHAPLIKIEEKVLKSFLKSFFIDAEGNELSESTINTLFTEVKHKKRAMKGNRIELTNVKIKEVKE